MAIPDPSYRDHQAWLGYLQPDGLVVSPAALVDSQLIIDRSQSAALQHRLAEFTVESESDSGETQIAIPDIAAFLTDFLEWPADCLHGEGTGRALPDDLRVPLPELENDLTPTFALSNPRSAEGESPWLMLIKVLETGTPLDLRQSENTRTWNASEHQRFERLLRETKVTIGLITNHREFRLVYAPRGESAGSITFPAAAMVEVSGRLIIGAFHQLLKGYTLLTAPSDARLTAVLKKSRDYQANVSIKLAEQVVEALYELLRGFQSANGQVRGELLRELMANEPNAIYRGLLNSLLRIVFLLYAEDRGLMPVSSLYVRNYSIHGLFERLRADAERYPDTMDHRYGAWSQLLAVFRLVFNGSKNPLLGMPPRRGYLFDPSPFPFLEGRSTSEPNVPLVPDGTIFRVLSNLLLLDGERLSYKTLDVEQIGSVYETIMGFRIEQASGRMIALKPKKRHGAPVHINLDALVALKPADREKALNDLADTKLPEAPAKALKAAASVDDLLAAVEKRIDKRASPALVPVGSIILQPTDERRRSGSHYTPRSFTEPIVRKTLEPIIQRMGEHPSPEQILDLKVADIAVGSAAFLVETCRQLADMLVASWRHHLSLPRIPEDEDELLYARRLVAQRCLYGVDRNPMAVDLAKLSLWLATMAKDHPFTFLDHAIKCGDSLVGLTNKQIAAFHWDLSAAKQLVMGQTEMERRMANIAAERKRILDWTEDTESAVLKKSDFLAAADAAARSLKTTGDLVIAAFFAGDKPKQRQQFRDEFLLRHLEIQKGEAQQIPAEVATLNQLREGEFPIRPFHWEVEFPEVFTRENPGFDGIVGNPPFAGKNTVSSGNRAPYPEWIQNSKALMHGNSDLVAHFFRTAFDLLRPSGSFGLIATNTIGQGDTRTSGLRWICTSGGHIYAAHRRAKWPGEAAVIVSIVWVIKGHPAISCELDGRAVDQVTAYLFHAGSSENPQTLKKNSGLAFKGSETGSLGYLIEENSPLHGSCLKAMRPDGNNLLKYYLTGSDLNASPVHLSSRFVLDVDGLTANQFAALHDVSSHLNVALRPDLLTRNEISDETVEWWHFRRPSEPTRAALSSGERLLGISRVSDTGAFAFIPQNVLPNSDVICFTLNSYPAIAVLQSRVHEFWMRFFASSMKDDLRYAPSDCFETFPFPPNWEENAALEEAGRGYYEFRAALMIQSNEGLTKTYNRFHDPEETSPDIHKLRELHAAMDRAVLAAYGWPDISTACEFLLDYEEDDEEETSGKKRKKKKPYRYRWPDEVRDEVLARLLALNAERAAQEILQSPTKKTAAKKVAKKQAPKHVDQAQEDLFSRPIQGAPWRERIAAFRFDIPDSPRPADTNSLFYYRILIPALIQEAGGSVPWDVLHTAAALLHEKELLQSFLSDSAAKDAKAWSRKSKLLSDPDVFAAAIEEAILTSKKVRITGNAPSFDLRLAPDVSIHRAPWHILDARLALTAAAFAIARGTSVSVSEELNEKIIQFARTA